MTKALDSHYISIVVTAMGTREQNIYKLNTLLLQKNAVTCRLDEATKCAFLKYFLYIRWSLTFNLSACFRDSSCFFAHSHANIIPGSAVPSRIFIHTQVLLLKLSSSRLKK